MFNYNTRLLEEVLSNQEYIIAMLETKFAQDELKEIQEELEAKKKESENE